MPRSTPFWIAVGKRLVQFFGGEIDYQDCDEIDVDFARPSKSLKINDPQDDDEWDTFQRRLFRLKPLMVEDIKDADQYAAYKLDGTR
jgi:hypothetical protein